MAAALWALWALLAALPGPEPAGAAQVPLLVWSTERSLWPPQAAPGGRVVSLEELQELLEPGLRRGPRTVLLFLQDQLSLDDFTAFGGVFGNEPNGAFPRLKAALSSAGSSLTVPSLSGAAVAALPLTLQRALGAPPPLSLPGGALGGLRLNRTGPESDGEPTVLLVGLPHSRSSGLMGPREALTSNDAVLGEVLRVLQEEQIPYTALLSARAPPSPARPRPDFGSDFGSDFGGDFGGPQRALLGLGGGGEAAEPLPPLRWPPPAQGDPKILLWARNLSVTLGGRGRDLTPQTFGAGASVELGGSWSPQEARLELRYPEVFGEPLNITFILRHSWFPVSARPWAWLDELLLTLGGSPPARFRVRGAAAPSPLGWRCSELGTPGPLVLPLPPLEHSQRWGLRLIDLQVQGFNVSGGVFGGPQTVPRFLGWGLGWGCSRGGSCWGGSCWGGWGCWGCGPWIDSTTPGDPPCPCRSPSEEGAKMGLE